ncbi:MAG: DUF1428 domain-containing protein [bacterium]|nr:DUF1428 domain-containing protein [bacterium]
MSFKAKYVDAFVLVVPKDKVAAYKKMAKGGSEIWMKHGALSYRECKGDDLNPEMKGCPYLPFPQLTKLKPSETVWFSYIEYKSKAHRNSVNKKVMKEMEKEFKDNPMPSMPFDSKRMSYGGFTVEVS